MHTHCPSIAKINKVKDIALVLLIIVFNLSSLHLESKKHRFAALFTHNLKFSFSVVGLNPAVVTALLLFTLLLKKI